MNPLVQRCQTLSNQVLQDCLRLVITDMREDTSEVFLALSGELAGRISEKDFVAFMRELENTL